MKRDSDWVWQPSNKEKGQGSMDGHKWTKLKRIAFG